MTDILRALLYGYMNPIQLRDVRTAISLYLPGRNDISINRKLLSLTQQIQQKPWAYPACLDTRLCRQFYSQLQPISNASGKAADTLGDPFSSTAAGGAASHVTSKMAEATRADAATAFGVGFFAMALVNFFGGKSKSYYDFYIKRISDELALRGIPPSSL